MFKLTINTGNTAFHDEYNDDKAYDKYCEAEEISRILKEVIDKLEYGCESGVLIDINGNKVGEWSR